MNAKDLDSRLKDALTRKYGDHVVGVVTRHVVDSTGDPAVWVWVVLKDESLLGDAHRTEIEDIRAAAEEEVRSAGNKEWPYVTFRTRAEQQEIEAEAKGK